MKIVVDDLSGGEIAEFLERHVEELKAITPPESKHALDLDGLRDPAVTFWTMLASSSASDVDGCRVGDVVVGCCALKRLDATHAELKSMRVAPAYTRRGLASVLVEHVLIEAALMGFTRVSLETGAFPFFEPARRLYAKHGFVQCGPFAGYSDDPRSVFMTRLL